MRKMYDAVTASRIPADAQMVAGYCDTIKIPQWTADDWARFPNAVKVRIAKKATTNDGHVLDVELGDATPAQAPGWVRMRRAAGADPTVYCSASAWPQVRAAFRAAGVAEPHYMIAHYDGDPTIPAGAIAKQHTNTAGWDLSSVADYWPGVDMKQEDDMQLSDTIHQWDKTTNTVEETIAGIFGRLVEMYEWARTLQESVAALSAAVAAIAKEPIVQGDVQVTGTVHIGPAGGVE